MNEIPFLKHHSIKGHFLLSLLEKALPPSSSPCDENWQLNYLKHHTSKQWENDDTGEEEKAAKVRS